MNILLVCSSFRFTKIEYKKPPFNVIKFLSQIYNANATILFDNNKKNIMGNLYEIDEDSHDGIKMHKVNYQGYFSYLNKNAKEIDLIIAFHGSHRDAKIINYYKKKNKNGHAITIMDHSVDMPVCWYRVLIKSLLYHFRMKKYIKNNDMFTVETKKSLDYYVNHKFYGLKIKPLLMPFGINQDDFPKINVQKENLILHIGRLGSEQKNTKLFLEEIEKVNLKDYKVLLLGSVEEKFKVYLDEMIAKSNGKIEYGGVINDSKELAKVYARSKCFVLSSEFESFGLVVLEAAAYDNYIITTDCGVGPDLILKYQNGVVTNNISLAISNFINSEIKLNVSDEIREDYDWKNILLNNEIINKILK